MSTRTLTRENDVAYTDVIHVEPPSISELAQMQTEDPDAMEDIEYEVCDCMDGHPEWFRRNILPTYPELLKVHPKSYTIKVPAQA